MASLSPMSNPMPLFLLLRLGKHLGLLGTPGTRHRAGSPLLAFCPPSSHPILHLPSFIGCDSFHPAVLCLLVSLPACHQPALPVRPLAPPPTGCTCSTAPHRTVDSSDYSSPNPSRAILSTDSILSFHDCARPAQPTRRLGFLPQPRPPSHFPRKFRHPSITTTASSSYYTISTTAIASANGRPRDDPSNLPSATTTTRFCDETLLEPNVA